MTRDYKPARSRPAPSAGGGSSMLIGILIGLLLGLGIALAVALYLNKVPAPFVSRGKAPEPAAPAKADPAAKSATAKPEAKAPPAEEKTTKFDFYKILPGEDTPEARKAKEAKEPPVAAPTPTPAPTEPQVRETFLLQVGAFQSAADADNLKARVALLGMEATVQAADIPDKGTWHRVRVGPFTRVEDLNRARDALKQNGIDSTLIKARAAP